MGNQESTATDLRRPVEVIQAGIIAQVHDVHVGSNRPIWRQGLERLVGNDPIREGLAWDLLIG